MMYYVYALLSEKNNDLYIGYSDDLKKRFAAHNSGKVRSTKVNRPWILLYYEAYRNKDIARKREYQLKVSCNKEELKERLGLKSRSQAG